MDISKFLSKVLGIYLVIASMAMILNLPGFISNVNQLIHNDPLMFVVGIFILLLGILMIVSHNIWQWNWKVLITLISWLTFLKGMSILLSPRFLDATTNMFLQNLTAIYIAAALDLVLGLLLCYFGFKK